MFEHRKWHEAATVSYFENRVLSLQLIRAGGAAVSESPKTRRQSYRLTAVVKAGTEGARYDSNPSVRLKSAARLCIRRQSRGLSGRGRRSTVRRQRLSVGQEVMISFTLRSVEGCSFITYGIVNSKIGASSS